MFASGWLKRLWLVIWNAFLAGAEALAKKREEIKADQDRGATDQREADKKEDDKLATQAGELYDENASKTDDAVRDSLSKWLRKPSGQGGSSDGQGDR